MKTFNISPITFKKNTQSLLTNLACSQCGKLYNSHKLQTFSPCCTKPLLANYQLENAPSKEVLKGRPLNMWRYKELLPLLDEERKVSLGEGFTPILKIEKAAGKYGFTNVSVKDEAMNPTGSFKARGLSMAISKANEFEVTECIIPTAGNAGGAMSAYCAKAGMKATVVMPAITPSIFKMECTIHGADVIELEGLISDCGKKVAEMKLITGAFDISTMKEPYRLEGKKTMGYEIAEQSDWKLPDVIIYPAGGGTGLIGIWKAFKEMQEMGWITGPLPKMVAVQSANCQPVVKAYDDTMNIKNSYTKAKSSLAYGLAVPNSFGHDLLMKTIEESNGMAVAVSEEEIVAGVYELAHEEGLLVCPEGAATWKAMIKMKEAGHLTGRENILLMNTGSAYKYMDKL